MLPKSEEKVVVRPRTWIYILGLIFVVIMTLIETWLDGFTGGFLQPFGIYGYWFPAVFEFWGVFLWSFIFSIVIHGLNKVIHITRQEATILISMIYVTWIIPLWYGVASLVNAAPSALLLGEPMATRFKTDFAPTWFLYGPDPNKTEWIEGWARGGMPVPWGEWSTAILYFFATTTLYYISLMLVGCLFRRPWIDIEGVPFPMADGQVALIDMAVGSKSEPKPELFRNVFLWVGVIIAILMTASWWLTFFVPGWAPGMIGIDFTPRVLLPYAPLVFSIDPFYIGAMLLIPVSILESYLIFFVILYLIIPPVAASAGLLDKFPSGWGWYDIWWTFVRASSGPTGLEKWARWTYGHYNSIIFGGLLGIVLWNFWHFRRYWAESVKAIWKKNPEVEGREPLSYRGIWGGLLICGILYGLLVWRASNYELPGWFIAYDILIPVWLMVGINLARFKGDFGLGGYGWNICHYTGTPYTLWWFGSPSSPLYAVDNPSVFMRGVTAIGLHWWTGHLWGSNASTTPTILQSFRMGEKTETHPKYIFYGALIAIPVAIILSLVLILQWNYLYGALNKWSEEGTGVWNGAWSYQHNYWAAYQGSVWQWIGVPPTEWMHFFEFIGVLISWILIYVRIKFPWLPLHPIGFVASTLIPYVAFLPAIIALVAKIIVIRSGGLRAYEEKLMPLGIGLSAGSGVAMLISAFIKAFQILSA